MKEINLSNATLDSIDLSLFDKYLMQKYRIPHEESGYGFYDKSGKEHYRMLAYLSTLFDNEVILDIGTFQGGSALALSYNKNNKVTSVEKANVMETGVLWREIVKETHKDFSDITLENMLADNCAMQLVRNPKQFDVIVTDNLFGDLLSDCAAMLTGSLGMLPSASLGEEKNGKRHGLFEPVHGSAPDIAGQDKANPIATILSLSMMLKYNLNKPELSNKVESAVQKILSEGYRTGDIYTNEDQTLVSCSKMGDLIIERI